MCVSLVSDSSETVEVTIVKLDTLTVSDMRMPQMLIILTLVFSHGHTDLHHENNKCFISETIQAMPITFAVKIFRLKLYMTIASLMILMSRLSNYFLFAVSRTVFKLLVLHSNMA